MSDADKTSPWRLFAAGVPRRVAGAVARSAADAAGAPPLLVDVSAFVERDWEELGPSPEDAFLLWTDEASDRQVGWVRYVRARHPGVVILVRLRTAEPAGVGEMLRAGALEVFTRAAQVGAALGQARARAATRVHARPEPPARPAADGADRGIDTLFPNFFDWIYVVGIAEDGRKTFETVNAPLNAEQGFLRPEFAGRPVEECLHTASDSSFLAHLDQALREGRPVPFEGEHVAGGGTRSFQTILTPVRNKWGRIHRVAGVSRDITALKDALAAVRASEERLNHALEGTQQGLWDWDLSTGHVYRSPRWFEMIGLVPGAIPDTYEAGLKLIHPEDRRQLEAAMSAHLEGRLPRFQAEYRLKARGADWIWIFDAGKIVAWDSAGRPGRMAGMCTDITERRRAEEALRALVGGVVHEIRNPVYGISINLDALDATFGEEPRTRPFVTALRESAARIQSLMNDLRDYGEPRTLNLEPCRVRSLLESAVRSCDALAASTSCRLRLQLEDDLLVLPLNERRMHQVFRNLLENALQHAPHGSTVNVEARRLVASGHDWWTIAVSDAGSGFDAEALSRAFEPFFTRRDGGTGLGLSIVKRVVEEHGGLVEAANRPAGGACITVRLPVPRKRPGLPEDFLA
jgi:PAS domain S-box-containing protein